MKLTLIRKWFSNESTTGLLYVDNTFVCYTLEDVVRESKVYGKTAIPYGKYKVIINLSNRFMKKMPLLLNVPNFEGVRIHSGNTADDTEGCIIVGMTHSKDFVGHSRVAYNKVYSRIEHGLHDSGDVWLTICKYGECPDEMGVDVT